MKIQGFVVFVFLQLMALICRLLQIQMTPTHTSPGQTDRKRTTYYT